MGQCPPNASFSTELPALNKASESCKRIVHQPSLKVVDVTVYLWVSTSLCKCSTCIQQLSRGVCPGKPVEEEGEEGMLRGWEKGELQVASNRR